MINRTEPPTAIDEALRSPNGARFFRCALQVNPFQYVLDHKTSSMFPSEEAYNSGIIEACHRHAIEVIAVTDHHRISESFRLIDSALDAGIAAFPGFEAQTKDGVHILCIFESGTPHSLIERYLGDCGLRSSGDTEETCKYDTVELLEQVRSWNAIAIAPHATWDKGLLTLAKGVARAKAWKNENLLAIGIPGSASAAPEKFRQILLNGDPNYKRERSVALINCTDVSSPTDLAAPGATTLIKMTDVTIEGLRQAFLDSESRIRLNSDPPLEDRTQLIALTWDGGFLDGARVHFNNDLNVFIGGRGTGKSTIIESLRYLLGQRALGTEAQDMHEKIVRNVLKSGTKISLLVQSHRPVKRRFLIERTVPNAATVRDEGGQLINLTPSQILSGVELFGQHEIGEVARSKTALTELLGRFADQDIDLHTERAALARRLEESRHGVVRSEREQRDLADGLAKLPGLMEELKRYEQAGLEEKLRDQSFIVREEQVFRTFGQRLALVDEMTRSIQELLPLDKHFLNDATIGDLPAKQLVGSLLPIVNELERNIAAAKQTLADALERARLAGRGIYDNWVTRKSDVQAAYEKILRNLQKSRIDGEEFIRLRRRVEELKPLRTSEQKLERLRQSQQAERVHLLTDWDDLVHREFRRLSEAAKRVNNRLGERLRITVVFLGNHEPLLLHLKSIGYRNPETPQRRDSGEFSLRSFAAATALGPDELTKQYRLTASQAERIASAGLEWRLRLEELELPATTQIELNVGSNGHDDWRPLSDLSTGQKATAVLLLLLIDSQSPLMIDQPEDDLDNRFISESVVPRIREAKGRRQFVFATHNANIPVLGDAELIAGLVARGEAATGKAVLDPSLVGSIDKPQVAHFVEEVLEGGKTAFLTRQRKYGF